MEKQSKFIKRIQYILVFSIILILKILPRKAAIYLGQIIAQLFFLILPRLCHIGMRNLELAFPQKTPSERKLILRKACENLGRLLGEFSQFLKLTPNTINSVVVYEGLENYLAAKARGKGVIILTGHFGAWELSAFAHAMHGYPMNVLVRRIDNPLVEALIEQYRTFSGNRTLDKKGSIKNILTILRNGGTIGILADLNMTRDQGIFCDFFDIPACSTPTIAALALRTDAAIVPGFLIWDRKNKIHKLCFEPEINLIRTSAHKQDIMRNTQQFMEVLENVIRKYPELWFWIHRRWKTRPEGSPNLYEKNL